MVGFKGMLAPKYDQIVSANDCVIHE